MLTRKLNIMRVVATLAALLTLNFTFGDVYNHLFVIDWPGHARFHYAWFSVLASMLALFIIFLIWQKSKPQLASCRLACVLGLMIWTSNVIAGLLTPWYHGIITFHPSPVMNHIVHAVMILLFFSCWLYCFMHQRKNQD